MATEIGAAFRRKLEIVGVFVNASLGEIARAAEDHSLSIVQLHGDEGVSFCREVARKTGCRVIKAMRVRSGAEITAAEAFRVDFHLLDAHSDAAPGGTGERFDWELLRSRHSEIPLILAGGLRADNVAEAISLAQPVRRRCRQRRRVEPRRQGPSGDGRLRRAGQRGRSGGPGVSAQFPAGAAGEAASPVSRSASGPTAAASCPRC